MYVFPFPNVEPHNLLQLNSEGLVEGDKMEKLTIIGTVHHFGQRQALLFFVLGAD